MYDYDRSDLVKIEKHLDNEHINVPKDFKTDQIRIKNQKNNKTKNCKKYNRSSHTSFNTLSEGDDKT